MLTFVKLILCFSISLCFVSTCATENYYYEKGVVDVLSRCPGHYCGRTPFLNGSWSECGACERGSRRNASSACTLCSDAPSFYDWLYLGFMMVVPLVLHLLFVDMAVKRNKLGNQSWLVYASVVLEVLMASLITLLVTPPLGSLSLVSCRPRDIKDWYPLMNNPNPNYEGQLYCTHETVYPMYSMVLVAYSALLVMVLLLRPAVSRRVARNGHAADTGAVYSALYFLPVLTVVHAVLAGILYTIFPFLVIVGSIISCATYFAYQRDQSMSELVRGCVRDGRSVLILLGHWCLHAYGIVALTQLQRPAVHTSLCALVPVPALFYILTARFSDPAVIPVDGPRPPTPLSRASMSLTVS